MISNKSFEKTYKENLFIMKLLITQPEFMDDIRIIRENIGIAKNGFKTEKNKSKWYKKVLENIPSGMAGLRQDPLFNNAEKLVKKYKLRYNFLHHVEKYLLYNKIDAPSYNFDVSLGPDPRGFRANKWVSIKAYAPLTKYEIRRATKKLLELQKEFLPDKVILDLRPRIDIDLALKIEKEMDTRYKKKKKQYTGYLGRLEKEAQKDNYYKTEFEKRKKERPEEIEEKIMKKTSKEVAKKFLKTPETARKIYSIIKKKRKQLFGNTIS